MNTPANDKVGESTFRTVANAAIETFKKALTTGDEIGNIFQDDAKRGRQTLREAAERRAGIHRPDHA